MEKPVVAPQSRWNITALCLPSGASARLATSLAYMFEQPVAMGSSAANIMILSTAMWVTAFWPRSIVLCALASLREILFRREHAEVGKEALFHAKARTREAQAGRPRIKSGGTNTSAQMKRWCPRSDSNGHSLQNSILSGTRLP